MLGSPQELLLLGMCSSDATMTLMFICHVHYVRSSVTVAVFLFVLLSLICHWYLSIYYLIFQKKKLIAANFCWYPYARHEWVSLLKKQEIFCFCHSCFLPILFCHSKFCHLSFTHPRGKNQKQNNNCRGKRQNKISPFYFIFTQK